MASWDVVGTVTLALDPTIFIEPLIVITKMQWYQLLSIDCDEIPKI
jgi:hypothetical protein